MTASTPNGTASNYPMVPMHPKMVAAIKASPKGQIPPGLAKYLAAKKAGKVPAKTPVKTVKKKKKAFKNLALNQMEAKLGTVQ